jgi:hypothetical protein
MFFCEEEDSSEEPQFTEGGIVIKPGRRRASRKPSQIGLPGRRRSLCHYEDCLDVDIVGCAGENYKMQNGYATSSAYETEMASSNAACAAFCDYDQVCASYQYSSDLQTCRLYRWDSQPFMKSVSINDWVYCVKDDGCALGYLKKEGKIGSGNFLSDAYDNIGRQMYEAVRADTNEECAEICTAEDGCLAYEYQEHQRRCKLGKSREPVTSNFGNILFCAQVAEGWYISDDGTELGPVVALPKARGARTVTRVTRGERSVTRGERSADRQTTQLVAPAGRTAPCPASLEEIYDETKPPCTSGARCMYQPVYCCGEFKAYSKQAHCNEHNEWDILMARIVCDC